MNVLFTHCCPHCGRRKRMDIQVLGDHVQCIQCGQLSVAADRDIESEALLDPMKQHAELMSIDEVPTPSGRWRIPR